LRNPGGYAVITSPEAARVTLDKFRCESIGAGVTEMDTFVCVHCNRNMHVKPFAPMDQFGSMCRNCMKMTCPTCADGPCVPFQKRLEEMERKDYTRRQYERIMNY
jgi:hypothetical protein